MENSVNWSDTLGKSELKLSLKTDMEQEAKERLRDLKTILVSEIPRDAKKLPDRKLQKILCRLFRNSDDVDISNRKETGMARIRYSQDRDTESDLQFVSHSYGWTLIDETHLIWRFRLLRRSKCNPCFPLVTDSFKISYLPPDIKRSTLRYFFPDVRSIAISKKRVKNRLVDCLRFNIAEAVLKFRDPYDANENFEHAKNMFMDKIPVRVIEEHQGKLLARQRAITITNIPDKLIEDCVRAFFPEPSPITAVQLHSSPDKSEGRTAKIWLVSHAAAADAMKHVWLPNIAPLWYDWILPEELKISEVHPRVTNRCIAMTLQEMFGHNICISFQRRRKSVVVKFKSCKGAKQGFKYLSKTLKWPVRSDRCVLSEFSPPQRSSIDYAKTKSFEQDPGTTTETVAAA